jgi:hypothetical protein
MDDMVDARDPTPPSPGPPDVPEGVLEPVQARREALQTAATNLERSLAEPSDTPQWREGVQAAAAAVDHALTRHVSSNLETDGLLPTVVEAAPWLSGPADRLGVEHIDLAERTAALVALAADPQAPPEAVRDAAADLTARLLRHVQHAHDLLYDAFESDLGGSD